MSLYFESLGQGPDLVLLHGWAMNGTVWQPVAEQLAEDYCVHVVDLPGHGKSPASGPLTLDAMVAAIDAAFPWPVQVIGWSLGGAVATRWALQHPAKVRSLTLVASSPCFMQRSDWPHAMATATLAQFAASLQADWRGTLKRFISLQAMGDAQARAVARTLADDLFLHGEPALGALAEGLGILRDTDLRADMARLDLPVLLQYGDRDTLTPVGAAHWLAGMLPLAQCVIHAGAAHAPFLSHRDDFLTIQRQFLAGV
ncbi:pimeloyl-ACP methyl ester esterase BioH [Chitinilyticum litopenaei]|uniref:pimeloyl-ACP methyl ester esterase BioH n=1 Tax=Chitinilyticum litopenaei TaxID=1121276 RepID=UPI0003FB2FD5|nr:pimeloyl-ACP methyl ester esterase BioH [Chitinilyticum litopenaei]